MSQLDPRRPLSRALEAPITRRRMLQGSAIVGVSAFLAACQAQATPTAEPTPTAPPATPGPTPVATPTAAPTPEPTPQVPTGPLNFANWPAYIDLNEEETESPTLEAFKAKYGVDVNYVEDIQDNESFVATIRPQLQAGLDTGWDLIVLTDWTAAKIVAAGWTEKIDQANVPNCVANLRDELRGLDWDPNQDYHYPWQSGATGVGYNSTKTGRDLTKVADLFDPAFAGKATLLESVQDTFALVGLMMKAQGKLEHDPEEYTLEDAQKIHDEIKPFVESGHVRGFTGNEYLQDFGSGDTWVAIVWSGDLASSGGENDVFVYPEEGSFIWTDNMLIPKGAQHKYTAELYMNFVYDVAIAAELANWIYYISPVKGAGDKILELDPSLADDPYLASLLFPPPEVAAKQHTFVAQTQDEENAFNDLLFDLTGQ